MSGDMLARIPSTALLPQPCRPLVYHVESFDTEGEPTEQTGGLGPLDVLAELAQVGRMTDEQAAEVFRVLAAPGTVRIEIWPGWSFALTSEEER